MGKESGEKISIFQNYRMIQKGHLDINGLFAVLPKWFGGFEYDYWETGMGQKDIGIGKEYTSDWKAVREINDYVKFEIIVKVFIKNINKVKDPNVVQAETEVYINSAMYKNYMGTFGKDKFQETLRRIYERYVRYQDLLDYEDKLAFECVDLLNLIKSHFK